MTLNGAIKCLGFCGTRKQVSFQNVFFVVVKHFLLLNLDFGCATVLMMGILCGIHQNLKVPHGKTIVELEEEIEENKITIYVRSVSNATKNRKQLQYRMKSREDR